MSAGFLSEVQLVVDHWFYLLLLLGLWLGMSGRLLRNFGLADLYHDDEALIGAGLSPVQLSLASPALWGQFGWVALIGTIWIAIHTNTGDACSAGCPGQLWGPDGRVLGNPTLLMSAVMLAGVFLGIVAIGRDLRGQRADGSHLPRNRVRNELLRAILGGVAGLLLIGLVVQVSSWLGELWPGPATDPDKLAGLQPLARLRELPNLPAFWAGLIIGVGTLVANGTPKQLPSLAVSGFLAGSVILIASGGLLFKPVAELAIFAVLAWATFANSGEFKSRIPGFDAYYDGTAKPPNPNDDKVASTHPAGIHPVQEALANWKATVEKDSPGGRPKLVILATSGGAYRASFWTAVILDYLGVRGPLKGLTRNIRLITGASGGMVAGAYFAAMGRDTGAPQGSIVSQIEEDTIAFQQTRRGGYRKTPIPRDSLTPVVQRLLRQDFPRIFWPARIRRDRGHLLDEQWQTLHLSFAELADSERAGKATSVILSPMLAESGAPAFFSNLSLTAIRARGIGASEGRTRDDINKESVEVFEVFPRAHREMKLATAVRLNATFPFVSPSISLPVRPSRRVVDAGYYDNYGIDVAAAYLDCEPIRDWIVKNCSGVAVIEVRAFPTDFGTPPIARWKRAWQFLTSPIEAVASARGSSQLFRNNQQLRRIQAKYNAEAAADFLEVFTLEASVEASMSWTLPDDDLKAMCNLMPPADGALSLTPQDPPDTELLQRRDPEAVRQYQRYKRWQVQDRLARLEAFWSRAPAPVPEDAAVEEYGP